MKSKTVKKVLSVFVALSAAVAIMSAAGCDDDEVINLREGTWRLQMLN